MGWPAPSRTLYVGICFSPLMTELKKCNLEVIGEEDVGSVPSAFVGSSGVVPAMPLVWSVRGTLESKGEESLGMRTGRNMVVDGRKERRTEYKRPGCKVRRRNAG